MVVWINHGIITEEKGGEAGEAAYRLTSGEQSTDAFGAAAADDEGGGGGGVASAEDQAAAGMKAGTLYLSVGYGIEVVVSNPARDSTNQNLPN